MEVFITPNAFKESWARLILTLKLIYFNARLTSMKQEILIFTALFFCYSLEPSILCLLKGKLSVSENKHGNHNYLIFLHYLKFVKNTVNKWKHQITRSGNFLKIFILESLLNIHINCIKGSELWRGYPEEGYKFYFTFYGCLILSELFVLIAVWRACY